ncbi:MAG TPA: hypothetical protein VFX60_19225 [Micromonospora sp.]|nr:hypothetical protein [Micromonospora sp.]
MRSQTIAGRGHQHRAAEHGRVIDQAGGGDPVPVVRCRCGAERQPGGVWRGGRMDATARARAVLLAAWGAGTAAVFVDMWPSAPAAAVGVMVVSGVVSYAVAGRWDRQAGGAQ